MKNKNIALIASFTLGAIITPVSYSSANEMYTIERVVQDAKSVSITVYVNYLGKSMDGVAASIIKDGKVVAESITDSKGKAVIKVDNYEVGAVDLQLKKEGYQTQILSGLILKNGSDYKFSLTKGTGVVTTEVSTGIDKIESKSADEIEKIAKQEEKARQAAESSKQDAEKSQEKAGTYTEAAKAEEQKRKASEDKSSEAAATAAAAAAEAKKMEEKLSGSESDIKQREEQAKQREQQIQELEVQRAAEESESFSSISFASAAAAAAVAAASEDLSSLAFLFCSSAF